MLTDAGLLRRLAPLVLVLISGCTQWHYELGDALPIGYEQQARGESLANVLSTLGPPLRLAVYDEQMVMAWEAWRIRESALGVSLGWIGADLLTMDVGNAEVSGDYLLLGFDAERRVSTAARVRRDGSLGGGAAIQPLYGFLSVVDVQDLLMPLPQHAWGASQLLPLPQAINNPQRPGMADTGLEQRGTPTAAGARALEWLD